MWLGGKFEFSAGGNKQTEQLFISKKWNNYKIPNYLELYLAWDLGNGEHGHAYVIMWS